MPTATAVRPASLASAIVAANIARRSLSRSKLPISPRSSLTTSSGRLRGSPSDSAASPKLSSAIVTPRRLTSLQRRAGPLGVAQHGVLADLEAQRASGQPAVGELLADALGEVELGQLAGGDVD